MNKAVSIAVTLAALAIVPLAPVAAADANPVKERQKLMRSIGKPMQDIGKMLKGDVDYNGAMVGEAMKAMQQVATAFPALFPANSDMNNSMMEFGEESDAKPEIWAKMDDFKVKAEALKTAAAAAEPLAGDKAGFSAAFAAVGKTCKSCHSDYKKPDEK